LNVLRRDVALAQMHRVILEEVQELSQADQGPSQPGVAQQGSVITACPPACLRHTSEVSVCLGSSPS